MNAHRYDLANNIHVNQDMATLWDAYTRDAFSYKIIERAPQGLSSASLAVWLGVSEIFYISNSRADQSVKNINVDDGEIILSKSTESKGHFDSDEWMNSNNGFQCSDSHALEARSAIDEISKKIMEIRKKISKENEGVVYFSREIERYTGFFSFLLRNKNNTIANCRTLIKRSQEEIKGLEKELLSYEKKLVENKKSIFVHSNLSRIKNSILI